MAPALKLPEPSLKTIVLTVLVSVAVVAELDTFPAVAIVANFVSAIAALAEISAFAISPSNIFALVIAFAATTGKSAVPVKSPANLTLPLTAVVASGAAKATYDSTALTLGYIVVEPVLVVMFVDKLLED